MVCLDKEYIIRNLTSNILKIVDEKKFLTSNARMGGVNKKATWRAFENFLKKSY